MAGIDFSDQDAAVAWLESQSVEVRCAIASRAALRVCANVGLGKGDSQNRLALIVFRATLTSAVRGLGRTADVLWLTEAARAAAKSATNSAYAAVNAVAYSAHAAAKSAANSAYAAAYSATNAAALSAYSAALSRYSAAKSAAASSDAANSELTRYLIPLWSGVRPPDAVANDHRDFVIAMAADRDVWGFWHDWYLGMWEGTFRNWDLATEVAKIPDDVWERGAKAVAEEIEKIRSDRKATLTPEEARQEAFEPNSVDRVVANKAITSFMSYRVAMDAAVMFEAFHRKTGLNQVPEQFAALAAMPASLTRISEILSFEVIDPRSKQDLLEEIGRLNAKVATLEAALEKLNNTKEQVFAPALKKQIAASIGDWKLYAALAAGVWMLSGDDLGMQKRLENIVSLRDSIFGADCPAPGIQSLPEFPRSYTT